MNVGKSNAKMYVEETTGVTFKDVAGQDEAKEALNEIVDFLHEPVLRQPSVGHIFEKIRLCAEAEQGDFRIFSLTYELLRQLSAPAKRSVENYAVYARTHLETMYMTAVSIEDLASTLHIDRRYLTNVFRKSYGISPHAFLMELRLNKAREFLRSGCSVTDAAAMAGFSDLPNFSKKYRRPSMICRIMDSPEGILQSG